MIDCNKVEFKSKQIARWVIGCKPFVVWSEALFFEGKYFANLQESQICRSRPEFTSGRVLEDTSNPKSSALLKRTFLG